ncbi:inositol monophosphatase family protein [Pontixanthobacter aestiaquae]|uniref:Inositol monophosphatase n=1 Tax=Pontixanthobacter aestiaquae TaxID=1509367 RepID=A0A844Z978_9SPHN|nr:inositol monophosphatase family protein [Pontixanthobacter aestiaquae]MDN3645603.1 inositol monophosphatase family protein [Pontixanthobacter aestiaquae]MXO83400.1 inositol monophosphatase [Pontixanthobacter aestiaquae]
MTSLNDAMLSLLEHVSETAILPRFRNLESSEIADKGKNELVTVADKESEVMLAEGLEKLIPGLAIVGEEASEADPSVLAGLSQQCWIIDPIDGTGNFASGSAPFGILIALAGGGITQAGWIYDPLTKRYCTARRGEGAFVNGEKVTAKTTGQDPPIAGISTLFMQDGLREQMQEHIAPHYTLVDIPRCAAEQYPRLALGTNDVTIFQRTLPWDHAAGALWLNETGGKVARNDGSDYRVDEWDRPGLIGAASPSLWKELAARVTKLD